jgi:protein-S-isoprenylcysteine O-methyltransferase Ste14
LGSLQIAFLIDYGKESEAGASLLRRSGLTRVKHLWAVKRRQILELGVFAIIRIVLFILSSIFLVALSWRCLHSPKSHGFYRFFAFEAILILILLNIPYWIRNPFSLPQLFSWLLLSCSIFLVFQGFYLLHKLGGHEAREDSSETYAFEDTAALVTDGIYKYIRHPLYSSLLLLGWGAYLKHVSVYATIAVLFATLALVATAKSEERENISFFGSSYGEYIKRSKMFIPYLF